MRLEAELTAGISVFQLLSFSCSLEAPVRLLEDTHGHLHPETCISFVVDMPEITAELTFDYPPMGPTKHFSS